MRSQDTLYQTVQEFDSKETRLVVHIDVNGGLWLTSHSDINISSPGTVIHDVLQKVSSTSQKINPSTGNATIGSISFDVLDRSHLVSDALKSALDAGEGLKGKVVKLYRGDARLDFADYQLEQTQEVHKQVKVKDYSISFQCADIQRRVRHDIFNLNSTELAADFLKSDTVMTVASAASFEPCPHTTSFSDAGDTGSYYYLKLKYKDGFEVVRATGKTQTSFTGITRGLLGTKAVDHKTQDDEGEAQVIQVEEYVYLEMPTPALAFALLTGEVMGHGTTLPSNWHLGVSTDYVTKKSFRDCGVDLFDPNDYTKGLIARFEGLTKTDGKAFIEKELCLLSGAIMPILSDGSISWKRMQPVVRESAAVMELGVDHVISYGELSENLDGVHNELQIAWGATWVGGEVRYLRQNSFADLNSIGIHSRGKPFKFKFRGLSTSRHTTSTLRTRFDALRDRYTHPPLGLTLRLLPSVQAVEVADVVRVTIPYIQDHTTGGGLDRAFEVQSKTVDQVSGVVTVSLFGSGGLAQPIADDGLGYNSELPDGWYTASGIELPTVVSVSNGVLQSSAEIAAGTYYVDGDFTIPSGLTLTYNDDVILKIRGHVQIDGELNGYGRGLGSGQAGAFGSSWGGKSNTPTTGSQLYRVHNTRVKGLYDTIPHFNLNNNAGELEGLPDSLVGSGGGYGANAYISSDGEPIPGAAGGTGGAGLLIVSRGVAFGASGKISSNGTNGLQGIGSANARSGDGGGGCPGATLIILDGSGVAVPILSDSTIDAVRGASGGDTGGADTYDFRAASARYQYVPKSRDPYPDYDYYKDQAESIGGDGSQVFQQDNAPTDQDSQTIAGRDLRKGDFWLDSSDNDQPYVYKSGSWSEWDHAKGLANAARSGAVEDAAADDRTRNNWWTASRLDTELGWTERPKSGANKFTFHNDSRLGKISFQYEDGPILDYDAITQAQIDDRADSRIGSLRPDSSYKNSNTTKADVGLSNVDDYSRSSLDTYIRGRTTKSDVGLGSVENKSSSTIRGELTKSNVTNTGLAADDIGAETPSGALSGTRQELARYQSDNLVLDGDFIETVDNGSDQFWVTSGNGITTGTATNGIYRYYEFNDTSSDNKYIYAAANGATIQYQFRAGEEIHAEMLVNIDSSYKNSAATPQLEINITLEDDTKTAPDLISKNDILGVATGGWRLLKGSVTIPADAKYGVIRFKDLGTIAGRIRVSAIRVYRVPTGARNSNIKYTNPLEMMPVLVSNAQKALLTSALSATSTGKISILSHDVQYGSVTHSYNAVSNAITGLTQGQTYYVADTDGNAGAGTKTYVASTDRGALMAHDERRYVGAVTIPSSGTNEPPPPDIGDDFR